MKEDKNKSLNEFKVQFLKFVRIGLVILLFLAVGIFAFKMLFGKNNIKNMGASSKKDKEIQLTSDFIDIKYQYDFIDESNKVTLTITNISKKTYHLISAKMKIMGTDEIEILNTKQKIDKTLKPNEKIEITFTKFYLITDTYTTIPEIYGKEKK